jgi:hypothetical protein
MLFTFQGISKPYQVTVKNNFFCFGFLKSLNECFEIPLAEITFLYEVLIEVITNLENNISTKKEFFYQNFSKGHIYYYEVVETNFIGETRIVKFICECPNLNTSYDLELSKRQILILLNYFRFFLFSTLPIDTCSKVWLQSCANFDLAELQDNSYLLFKKAEKFLSTYEYDSDIYVLIELFHCYFNHITVYKKLSELNKVSLI